MILFAELDKSQLIFLGIVVVAILFLLMRTSRYFMRPKSPEPTWSSVARRPKGSDDRGERVPQEMASWEVEMHEFVREIKAELDTKMRALEAVTADADRAAARLEAAIRMTADLGNARAGSTREGEAPAEPRRMQTPPAVTARQEPRAADATKSIQQFRENAGKGMQGIDLSNLPTSQVESLSPAGVPHSAHSSAQAKKEEIYTLADYGMTPAEIASRVGHPIGEVELILSLRVKK